MKVEDPYWCVGKCDTIAELSYDVCGAENGNDFDQVGAEPVKLGSYVPICLLISMMLAGKVLLQTGHCSRHSSNADC